VKRAIPIENIYYLFCYVWDRFPEGQAIGVGRTDSPKIWDLFASVLVRGVNRLKRRGLDRGYDEIEEETSTIRGRIIMGETLRRNLLVFGRANCRFDELRHDILHNQIIKATLSELTRVDELDASLRHELRCSTHLFSEVSDISLSSSLFRRVQLSRNNANYDLLLKICELMHSAQLPHQQGRSSKFSNALEDENIMAGVFESFVRNFFKREQSKFTVASECIQWDGQALNAESAQYLPTMRTDVTLRSNDRTIIIDAKYYTEALTENYGRKKLRSDHLYQLFSYLKNCRSRSGIMPAVEGILVYPATSQPLDLQYTISGHVVRIRTIRLDQPWKNIHTDMCALLGAIRETPDDESGSGSLGAFPIGAEARPNPNEHPTFQ
jgi:5-methylcytosine-specific restriction enzyme subunit McrC